MANKFDRFTDDSRRVLTIAQSLSVDNRHKTITPGYLLLALLEQDEVLQHIDSLGLEPELVKGKVEELNSNLPLNFDSDEVFGLTERAKKVIVNMIEIGDKEGAVWYTPLHMFKAVQKTDPILQIFLTPEGRPQRERG